MRSVSRASNRPRSGTRLSGVTRRLCSWGLFAYPSSANAVRCHNALGQRVFKSEPQGDGNGPEPAVLGADFAAWLKKNFGRLYAAGQADASVGTAYTYADESSGIPSWAVMWEYDNGSASGKGGTEYIWLPVQSEAAPLSAGPQSQSLSGAFPVGFIRNNRIYAIHSDHLGTPRLVTDDDGKPIWQWPYSAFGGNAPTGVLRVTTNAASAITNQPVQLRATTPQEFNLRFPVQYWDAETKLSYNYFRNYQPNTGRYTQSDPIGLDGGWNRIGYSDGNPLGKVDPEGLEPSRAEALNDIKRTFGISASPIPEQSRVPLYDGNQSKPTPLYADRQATPAHTREYKFNVNGRCIVVQDHSAGHMFKDASTGKWVLQERGHFNVRDESGKTASGAKSHYTFASKVDPFRYYMRNRGSYSPRGSD